MTHDNADSANRMTGIVDCEMPPILNQKYKDNSQGVKNTGCALCCGINLASFKKGKRYTIAEFAGHYSSGTGSNGQAYVSYGWTAPDGITFTGPVSIALSNEAGAIKKIRNYVDRGIPVACHAVGGNGNEHWFVAYHADDNGGDTWETSGLYVLDPYNGNKDSYYGRTVSIWDAMSKSSVTAGIDRVRMLA